MVRAASIRRRRARAARRSSPASPAGRRSRCACRPAARSTAPTASSRRRAARARSLPIDDRRRRGRAHRRRGIQGNRAHRRPSRLLRTRSVAPATSLLDLLHALDGVARRRDVPRQLARADGLHAGDRRARGGSGGGSRRISTCRCSTPAIACWRDAPALHARLLPAARRRHRRAPAARVDRIGHDRRISWRDRRRFRGEPRLPAGVAAVAPARVSVLGPSGHRGVGDARQGPRLDRPGARARSCATSARRCRGASASAGRHDSARA